MFTASMDIHFCEELMMTSLKLEMGNLKATWRMTMSLKLEMGTLRAAMSVEQAGGHAYSNNP